MSLIVATIGHAGRPSRWNDRGACFDGVEEVTAVRRYLGSMDAELRRLGHQVALLSDGEYREQWARADAYGAQVYLNAHVNAGAGDYGLVFYDHRSRAGLGLAEEVALALDEVVSWKVRPMACRPDTNGVPRDGDYSEAFNTIAGVKAPALCLEPYFLDGPRRRDFLAQLDAIGVALARGLAAWCARA